MGRRCVTAGCTHDTLPEGETRREFELTCCEDRVMPDEGRTDNSSRGGQRGAGCSCTALWSRSPTLSTGQRRVRASGGSTRGGIRTLADVADDAAGDRVCGDPDALLEPFLPRRAPGVLDGDEGLREEHLQGVAGRVGPQEAANR